MPAQRITRLACRPWQRYPFWAFTALTVPACALLILWLDKPLALLLHRYAVGLVPAFAAGTAWADAALTATNVGGRPTLYLGLGLAYLLGRWVARRRAATVLLLVLLTQSSSIISVNMLKGTVHRLRPDFLADGTDAGGLLGHPTGAWDSFPSGHTAQYWGLLWPLACAFPRWRWPLLALPVFIALGRLVLGVHYLSDVWAAIWLVVAWAALWQWLRQQVGQRL